MLYEKKDEIKLSKDVQYPLTARNFKRVEKICNNKDELLEHLICQKEVSPITQILSARLHPEIFISDDSFILINHYIKFKRYGMQFLYPKGIGQTPNIVMQSFDIITTEIEKKESDLMKKEKTNIKAT